MYTCFLTKNNQEEWNKFVYKNSGTIFHLWEWGDIIAKHYGYKKLFFIITGKNKEILGIAPLYLDQNKSKTIVTLPCTGFCNFLTVNNTVKEYLLSYIYDYSLRIHANISIFTTDQITYIPNGLCMEDSNLRDYVIEPCCNYNNLFSEKFSKKRKQYVRQTTKSKILVTKANMSDINEFYAIHLAMMRNLNLSTLTKEAFRDIYKVFQEHILLIKGTKNGIKTSYIWAFVFNNQLLSWRLAHIKGNIKNNASYDILTNYLIKFACDNKDINFYDCGTAGCAGGLAKFKESWGFQPKIIYIIHNKTKNPNFLKEIYNRLMHFCNRYIC